MYRFFKISTPFLFNIIYIFLCNTILHLLSYLFSGVREINHAATFTITKDIFILNLPNEMQYAIRKLYPTDRKDTLTRSERIERIAKHTDPLTIIKSLPNDKPIYDRHTLLNGP